MDEALDDLGEVKDILSEAYAPEATREESATAIGKALEVLESYGDEDEDEEGEGDEDEDDDE